MNQQAVDYQAAAKALAYERAPAWRPEQFETHPRMVGGPVVRKSRYETPHSQADVITIETAFVQGGTEQQVAWSLCA